MDDSAVDKAEVAFNLALASAKGVSALAIVMEKNVGINGAASLIHRIMLDGLQQAAGEDRPYEAAILAKVFGPNYPPSRSPD